MNAKRHKGMRLLSNFCTAYKNIRKLDNDTDSPISAPPTAGIYGLRGNVYLGS